MTGFVLAFEGDDYVGFIRNKYFGWYHDILLKAYERGPIPKPFDRHHPWPRSIPGGTKEFGFVTIKLTPREHVDVHWLLTKFTTGRDRYKMQVTMERMCTGKNGEKLKPCQVAAAMKAAREKRHPAETRRKISVALTGKTLSPEHCAKIVAANRGRKHTPETRARMCASRRKRSSISPETREKMRKPKSAEHRANMRGRTCTPETRAQLSIACSGWKHTPESRVKIATSSRGRKYGPRSPEARAKMSAARRGKPGHAHSAEARTKISSSLRGKPKTPEHRAAMRGRICTSETRMKIGASNRGNTCSLEARAKIAMPRGRCITHGVTSIPGNMVRWHSRPECVIVRINS